MCPCDSEASPHPQSCDYMCHKFTVVKVKWTPTCIFTDDLVWRYPKHGGNKLETPGMYNVVYDLANIIQPGNEVKINGSVCSFCKQVQRCVLFGGNVSICI